MTVAIRLFVLLLATLALAPGQRRVASVRIAEESAPAGGTALVQLELTEPQPILSGRFSFSTPSGPLRQVRGVGLFSDQFDVVGVARMVRERLAVFFASFSARIGLAEEIPIAVIAFDVDPNAQPGQQTQLSVGPGQLQLIDPSGNVYTNEIKPGVFEVGGLSISNVTPNEGEVTAGQTIVIRGVGFDPDADVNIEGVAIRSSDVVSAAEIRVVAGASFRIEGKRIRVRNKQANEEEFFFVFTPAERVASTQHPYLVDVIPIFDDVRLMRGLLRHVRSGGDALTAAAFKNTGAAPVDVTVETLDALQRPLGALNLTLAAGERSLIEARELDPNAESIDDGFIVARASAPVAMLGMRGLVSEESLTPVIFEDEALPAAGPAVRAGGVALGTLTPTVRAVAPRALLSVFGDRLAAPGTAQAVDATDLVAGRLPTRLAGSCLEIDGVRQPLLFASDGQINAQLAATGSRGPAALVVVRDCDLPSESRSAPETTEIADVSPAFFVMSFADAAGRNPIAALHGGGPELVGDPAEIPGARPARPGEWISLFGTGFGATLNGLAAGAIPANEPGLDLEGLSFAAPVSIAIGGIGLAAEDMQYLGAAPCCAGLDQLVVRVPEAAPAGRLEVIGSAAGVSTPAGPYVTVGAP